jgi:hypothetical protein
LEAGGVILSYIISPVSPLTSTLVAGNNNITGVATITTNTAVVQNLLQHEGALVGLFNQTPAAQFIHIVSPSPSIEETHAAVLSILTLLETIGLMAGS